MTHRGMMVNGLFQETSYTVITWNSESNCTCREKIHFLFQWNISTLPGLQIHPWMWCWRKHRWLLERWWRSRIVRYVDRFHKVHCNEWKTNGWIFMDRHRFGKICPIRRNAKKSKSGLSRNRSSKTPGDCVVFSLSNLMMNNSSV